MTKPLALILYDRLMPGSQVVERMEELGYRVVVVPTPDELPSAAQEQKPIIIMADLVSNRGDVLAAIETVRKNPETSHVPILAIVPADAPSLEEKGRIAGAQMVAGEQAINLHLKQLLKQALEID